MGEPVKTPRRYLSPFPLFFLSLSLYSAIQRDRELERERERVRHEWMYFDLKKKKKKRYIFDFVDANKQWKLLVDIFLVFFSIQDDEDRS